MWVWVTQFSPASRTRGINLYPQGRVEADISRCLSLCGGLYLHVLIGIILSPENQYVFKPSNNRNQVIRREVSCPIFASIFSVLMIMRSITFKPASREQVRVEDSYCKALDAWCS